MKLKTKQNNNQPLERWHRPEFQHAGGSEVQSGLVNIASLRLACNTSRPPPQISIFSFNSFKGKNVFLSLKKLVFKGPCAWQLELFSCSQQAG